MNNEKIKEAVQLAKKAGHVFLATADKNGLPHISAAGKISMEKDGKVSVTEWFCPGTLANLQVNKNVSIAIWDKKADMGFQLLGKLELIRDLEIMDGFTPSIESKKPLPQVEKQLLVKVKKILEFKLAPHSDMED